MADWEASDASTDLFLPGYWHWHAWKMRKDATRETLSVVCTHQTGNPRGTGRVGRVADGLVVPMKPGNAGGGKEPWFESNTGRKQGMSTDASLTGSDKVRKLQNVLHAKAKQEPRLRFHALIDKVWREDFLMEAWKRVRRNGGTSGVDAESFTDIELYGVERWLGELARDLRDGTYAPKPVRQVLIPKKQPGKFRPLGIPCIRDRVAQTSAMLVLGPIFEADLQPEQYAYRPQRSAKDAVKRVHSLLNRGYSEVVDCDLSNYFGEIPHGELMKSVARRVSDGRMLGLIKAWLEMPVEEDDGKGGRRRTNRAQKERKGTPQGSPISPLLSNLYMRRFILGWKMLGSARHLRAEIVNYADDICVLGRAPAADMLAAVRQLMEGLKLAINERKTRCLRCPSEPIEFLGYRIGRNYRPYRGGAYIGTRPSKASVQSICRKISEMTSRRYGLQPRKEMVGRLNRTMTGWANYFNLGQVSPAYHAIDQHAAKRLRQWLCRKHKVRSGKYVQFPNERLRNDYGLIHLGKKTRGFAWAKA
jgi:RNA-directed DNA polymerase